MQTTCPVGGHFIVLFECFLEVECMLLSFVLDAKIIHHQRELNGARVVFPQARHELALVVPVLVQPFFEELIGEESWLW